MQSRIAFVVLVTTAIFGASLASADAVRRKARIVPYGIYGRTDHIVVNGRVLEDAPARADKNRGPLGNLAENVRILESDEIAGVPVRVTLGGQTFDTVTDDDGIFRFERSLKKPLRPGRHKAVLAVGNDAFAASVAQEPATILTADAVIIVSDFDDTVVQSHVRDKKRLVINSLLKNAAQLHAVPGAAVAYAAAEKEGATFFYLSGSPINFHERIEDFLERNGFPAGPLLLKNFGQDPIFDQEGYKPKRLEHLLTTFPDARFILIGDSGEKDPEIYRRAQLRHPAQVHSVVIRRAPGVTYRKGRFKGMTVVDDYKSSTTRIAELVRAAKKR